MGEAIALQQKAWRRLLEPLSWGTPGIAVELDTAKSYFVAVLDRGE